MSNYYTGGGDKGQANVAKGRVGKDDPILAAIGDVDELNSCIGIAIHHISDPSVRKVLRDTQDQLFTLGANLSSARDVDAAMYATLVRGMEAWIATAEKSLPELRQFVIPGGSEAAAYVHLSRAIARRAERHITAAVKKYKMDNSIISYMNRLSSLLFVVALYLNHKSGFKEEHPSYRPG